MRVFCDRIREASDNAFNILKKYVPCSLEPYSVDKYHYNIGYGHRVSTYHGEKSEKVTQEKADELFKQDIREEFSMWAYDAAHNLINNEKVYLNQNQFDALTCYIYAIGMDNYMELSHRDDSIDAYKLREILLEEIPTKPQPGNWWYESALKDYWNRAISYIDTRIPSKIQTFFWTNHDPRGSISEYGEDMIEKLISLFRDIKDLYSTPVANSENYSQIIIKDNPYKHINPYEALSVLHNGEHEYIKWVQFEISRTELITIDGKFTSDFKDRLLAFQKSLGLEETGIIDYKLYQSLDERYNNAKNNIC
jgi:GH24 family phage-related lysozyme (muramidase)